MATGHWALLWALLQVPRGFVCSSGRKICVFCVRYDSATSWRSPTEYGENELDAAWTGCFRAAAPSGC